jgi:hypothetical protein
MSQSIPTAKHTPRLPTPKHQTRSLWARACCVAARQGLTVLGGRYTMVELTPGREGAICNQNPNRTYTPLCLGSAAGRYGRSD